MSIKKICFLSLMFALCLCFSIVEGMIPTVAMLPAGAKIGLSNIVVMYCLFFEGKSSTIVLMLLKSFFAFLTRGVTAGFLSLCGGVLSILVMIILLSLFKEKISYLMLSVIGAIFHNIGQFLAFSVLFGSFVMLPYLIPLLFFGIITGILSAVLLKFLMPYVKNIKNKN